MESRATCSLEARIYSLMFEIVAGISNGKLKNTTMNKIQARAVKFTTGPKVVPSEKVEGSMKSRAPKSIKLIGNAKDMFARSTLQPTKALKAVLLAR
jgi:hypothetical protein